MHLDAAITLVDEAMARGREKYDIPVVSYGLMYAGDLVHTGSFAGEGHQPATPRSTFRIASMTKSFTATTILILRERGLLRLDDRLDSWLPWTEGLADFGPPIRLRHLLTMNAGFPTDDPWGDRQEPLPLNEFDALVADGLSFCRPPGTGFEYSNLSYALLGRVISAVTGRDYRDVVQTEVLAPLGMTSSVYDVTEVRDRMQGYRAIDAGLVPQEETGPGAFSPMGGLWSNVEDLSRWVAGFETAWWTDEDHPLDRWSRREMQQSQITVRREGDVMWSYGFGLYITDGPHGRFVHHSGGYPGYGSHMRWHPDTRWAVIGLGNRTYSPMAPIVAGIMDDLVADSADDARAARADAEMWPVTRAAMVIAESLLERWDDAVLDSIAAMNIDLDRPRDERRAEWQRIAAECGPFVQRSVESRSPAHARWRMEGAGGDVWLEILLTPERSPKVQTLSLTRVDPSS